MRELHPLGTARQRLAKIGPVLPEDRVAIPVELLSPERSPEIDEVLLWQCWELVRLEDDESRHRPLFFLCAALLVAQRQGSTRLSLGGDALERALESLGASEGDAAAVRALLEEGCSLLGGPGDDRPLVLDGDALYTRKNRILEARVAEGLARRLTQPARVDARAVEAALTSLRDHPPRAGGKSLQLNAEQEEAVRRAALLPLSVISGGPGTGKTQIVVSILRVLVRLGIPLDSIALAAPTGKAANRMKESIRRTLEALATPAAEDLPLLSHSLDPKTLHRLLGYSPSTGGFRSHEENPLEETVVIVDEASMVDLGLMDRLLRSLRPEAGLVLLGDADQLPSVDAGAVLRDLVPAEDGPPRDPRARASVRLVRSYRMDPSDPSGRAILGIARAIQRGDVEGASAFPRRDRPEDLIFDQVEGLPAEALGAFCARWYRERFASWEEYAPLVRRVWEISEGRFADEEALRRLFARYDGSRILCLTRVHEFGADALNDRLHRLHLEAVDADPAMVFPPGEPLMMQRNDYARGLFNGDQGLVLRVRSEGESRWGLRVVFPVGEGFRAFPLDLASSLRPCWAMTVHKSQGSEFDAVAFVLPEADMPLLTREALYTALTRARKSVVVVGEASLYRAGIERRLVRASGIVERLQGMAAIAGG